LEQIEKDHITKVLKNCKGNITVSAKKLGIGRNTLYRKLSKDEIDCSEFEQCHDMEQSETINIAP